VLRRLRRVPLPLGLLLVSAAITGAAWCVLKPPLQGPDEVSHVTYVQRIVERPSIPWQRHPNPNAGAGHTEFRAALSAAGFGPLINNTSARPLWSHGDELAFAQAAKGADRTRGGETSTFVNPPLYYLYEAVPYAIGHGSSFFTRVLLMRLANVLLLLATIVFCWLLAGELLGRGLAQFVAAASSALLPQLLNITGTVNADNLLITAWTAALWLMALILRRGLERRLVVALAITCVAAALTHGRGLPLLLPAAITLVIAFARERGWTWATPVRVGVAAFALYLPVVFWWAGKGPKGNVLEFGSYVWQFYLPRLGSMQPTIGPPNYGWHHAYVDRLWGGFSHLEVVMPLDLADAVFTIVRVGLVLLVIALLVQHRSVRRQSATAVVLASAILALVLALHLIAYRSLIERPSDAIITGRYLLPLIALYGIAIAVVVKALPRLARAPAAGVVVGAGVAMQFVALGLVLERFYA
jgi:4-amino-4-deoxy-L-arabinose transferase-like glycosyltransferase